MFTFIFGILIPFLVRLLVLPIKIITKITVKTLKVLEESLTSANKKLAEELSELKDESKDINKDRKTLIKEKNSLEFEKRNGIETTNTQEDLKEIDIIQSNISDSINEKRIQIALLQAQIIARRTLAITLRIVSLFLNIFTSILTFILNLSAWGMSLLLIGMTVTAIMIVTLDLTNIGAIKPSTGGNKEETVDKPSTSTGVVSASKEEFMKQLVSTDFKVNEDVMIDDFVANSQKARLWGIDKEATKKLIKIIRSNGMSPQIFLAYELEEQGTGWGWTNYTSYTGDPFKDADFVSKHHVEVANRTGAVQLAWYDAGNPYYTTPVDRQKKGQEFADSLPMGAIGRMYLSGTAAATWGAFDPDALKGSVNGVQDYSDPIGGVMNRINKWK